MNSTGKDTGQECKDWGGRSGVFMHSPPCISLHIFPVIFFFAALNLDGKKSLASCLLICPFTSSIWWSGYTCAPWSAQRKGTF